MCKVQIDPDSSSGFWALIREPGAVVKERKRERGRSALLRTTRFFSGVVIASRCVATYIMENVASRSFCDQHVEIHTVAITDRF